MTLTLVMVACTNQPICQTHVYSERDYCALAILCKPSWVILPAACTIGQRSKWCIRGLLQELAKERFDATKYLGVFRRGHPDWLNELISDRRGRQLIYELSSTHRNSLLLNYAIQRILKQVGCWLLAAATSAVLSNVQVNSKLDMC